MDRREFLQVAAVAGAATVTPTGTAAGNVPAPLIATFTDNHVTWKVFEDFATRDGVIAFLSAHGEHRELHKSAEPTFPTADPPFLGLKIADIGMSGPDLLADELLKSGDPDPELVRAAAPPLASNRPAQQGAFAPRLSWNTFVGTKECSDTMPVFPQANTRTYHPNQYFEELRQQNISYDRHEGLVGGWMPAVRKVFPISANSYIEAIIFGDVDAKDRFIVQTWHRTARIEDGKITKVVYGYSYPAYPPARKDPPPEAFYRALLRFAEYWDRQLHDVAPATLPHPVWIDMAKHAIAKEIMVRPGGVYPKYGAVDRDYYGSEYDGFQDVFTSSVYTNLEWGRFQPARAIIDNYLTDFTDDKGMINMRGPETAQFGLTLSLLARYLNYTGDAALIEKHRSKIAATAQMLVAMHDESLRLPMDAPGHGLIHGWSESDACLAATPETWWQPYFANSAFSARGLRDISRVWTNPSQARAWRDRAAVLQKRTIESIEQNVRRDMTPPYIGPLPGAKLTFRESMATERPSPQQWPHRPYAELLQADILPPVLANTVIDCMRAYGATTMGVVANVGRANPNGRAILGFISYGYAQQLLRLDRIEEYLLFLYAHRFHDHTPGSWTAGEVSGITGGTAIFCIPAQQTIPMLVRWMLVLEDSDEDRLYLGKGLPREWIAGGQENRIEQAPTRWGRVNFRIAGEKATVELAAAKAPPKELHVKFRGLQPREILVNGKPATIGGAHRDTAIFPTSGQRHFELIART